MLHFCTIWHQNLICSSKDTKNITKKLFDPDSFKKPTFLHKSQPDPEKRKTVNPAGLYWQPWFDCICRRVKRALPGCDKNNVLQNQTGFSFSKTPCRLVRLLYKTILCFKWVLKSIFRTVPASVGSGLWNQPRTFGAARSLTPRGAPPREKTGRWTTGCWEGRD